MGGKNSSRGLRPNEVKSLGEIAKEALRKEQATKRNVFISFVEEDLDEVNLLRGQAKNENANIEFNDWSLREPFDSENAEYIRRGIRERIRQSSVTLIYVSDNTARSKWVDWEIRESIKMGKGVIAVHKGEAPPKSLPKAIKENKIKVLPWKQSLLTKAIDDAAVD